MIIRVVGSIDQIAEPLQLCRRADQIRIGLRAAALQLRLLRRERRGRQQGKSQHKGQSQR